MEVVAESGQAGGGEADCPPGPPVADPSKVKQAAGQRLGERTCQVVRVLAPVRMAGREGGGRRAALAGAGLALLYLIMFLASPASIGLGDGKLAASVGTALGWLGWRTLMTGTVACFLAAGLFAVLLLALRRAKRTDHMAFGPFILLGALTAIAI